LFLANAQLSSSERLSPFEGFAQGDRMGSDIHSCPAEHEIQPEPEMLESPL
jgi:hypothetical protein